MNVFGSGEQRGPFQADARILFTSFDAIGGATEPGGLGVNNEGETRANITHVWNLFPDHFGWSQ